eukprot:CAMPEP_0172689786 /NCGR_PEP_ID=MMETSP1074-20121228/23396_1 /TAXON_ID=2916 /ORGANISM="Ceratium fusus, Strain PA161109" /LENGTH=92 /DNA_ID=CAMNT_0013509643 /DNA_START=473 /DNA_END=751 /DNA_ORIENTATION=-
MQRSPVRQQTWKARANFNFLAQRWHQKRQGAPQGPACTPQPSNLNCTSSICGDVAKDPAWHSRYVATAVWLGCFYLEDCLALGCTSRGATVY